MLEHAGRRTVILRARASRFRCSGLGLAGAAGLPAASPDPPDLSAQRAGHRAPGLARTGPPSARWRRSAKATPSATSRSRAGLGGVAVPILLPDDGALVGSLAWSFPIERMAPDAEIAGRASWRGWRPRSRASTWRRPGVAPEAESGAGAQRLLVDLVGAGAGQRVQDLDHRWHLVARQVGLAMRQQRRLVRAGVGPQHHEGADDLAR